MNLQQITYHFHRFALILITLLFVQQIEAQTEIKLRNPSFEDIPRAGGRGYLIPIKGWTDCGGYQFPDQSPPDIHPTSGLAAWSVDSRPQDGNTFLGMVVRYDDTHESLGQRLQEPLLAGNCYSFSIYMSMSDVYLSPTNRNKEIEENFTTPAVLRIWGGNTLCQDRAQLLAESEPISNLNWKPYFFKFSPKFNYKFIILEAFYETPVLFPYNGHILFDNCSPITEIPCDKPMEDIVEEMDREETERVDPDIAMNTSPIKKADPSPKVIEKIKVNDPIETKEIKEVKKTFDAVHLPELNSEDLMSGQIFRIQNLYFAADSSRITDESFEVLDELAEFLRVFPNIKIEIGGHTAAFITPSFAKKLSLARAKAVTDYLLSRGVPEDQLKYEGYGTEKPIVKNDKYSRRLQQKNMRVEIKVLSTS